MPIHLDDVQLLIDVADCGSFSQAAARRGWSQPQVSQRIGALEAEVGAQMFSRHRRGALATAACAAFIEEARVALEAMERATQAAQGTPAMRRLILASLPSLATILFGPVLSALEKAPLEIHCTTDHSSNIMEQLLTGQADLGFVLRRPAIAGIQMERICRSRIVAVVHRRHRLARSGPTTLAAIANEKLAPQHWGKDCDELIRMLRVLRTSGLPIHAIEPASAARELAMEQGFLTFTPAMAIQRQLRDGDLVEVKLTDLPEWGWDVMMAWRGGKRSDGAKQLVLDAVRRIAADWQQE